MADASEGVVRCRARNGNATGGIEPPVDGPLNPTWGLGQATAWPDATLGREHRDNSRNA